MPLSDSPHAPARPPQPFLVALAAWALPGLGYGLIGHRARGLTVGVTIVALFVGGLLIGGVRSLDPPFVEGEYDRPHTRRTLRDELLAKPWYVAQVLTGPVALGASYGATWATKTVDPASGRSWGEESHARVNEIAVLYMAVAGMLNLLTIIDSAHRAGRLLEAK